MNQRGYSILEAIVAITIFAIGILALTHSYFAVMRAQVNARHQELATQCARDRMEEIVNSLSYADIAEGNFPDEDFGEIDGGTSMYQIFSRNVSIRDSVTVSGLSILKEVTVEVNWQTSGGQRDLTLNSVIARYRDVTL